MTARNITSSAEQSAAALRALEVVRAALSVWLLALPEGDTIDCDDASPLQVSMRGICELLAEAKADVEALDVPGPTAMSMLYAEGFVGMVEQCLWNVMAVEQQPRPTKVDLCATVGQAIKYIDDVARFVAGGAVAAGAKGGAA